jgi:asparagine synthase (glutamine-hydrolysing)
MADGTPARWVCAVLPGRRREPLEARPAPDRPPPLHVTEDGIALLVDGEGVDADGLATGIRRTGLGALERLTGIFAIFLWNPETSTFVAVRDAIGIHPLYYARSGDIVLVSAFVGALLEQPGVDRAVDVAAAATTLAGARLEIDETFFRGVRRVPPGHALTISQGAPRVFRWWDPGEPDSDRAILPTEADREFDELFATAVDRQLPECGIGIFLSGGIDSAAIASMAAERSTLRGIPAPLGLALMVDHPELDEEANQRAIASDLGLELVSTSLEAAVGPAGLLAATLAVSRSESLGPADIIQPVYDRLARDAVARHRTSIMSGQGGDEWLMPPLAYASDRMRRIDLVALARLWRAWHDYLPSRPPRAEAAALLWTNGLRPLVRATALGLGSARDRLRLGVLDELPSWLDPERSLRSEVADRVAAARRPPAASKLYRCERRMLLDRPDRPGLTEACFAAHLRTGVRVAMPLLDQEVVRYLYRLPPELLVSGGRAKALARATIAERLPSFGGGWGRTVSGVSYYGNLIARELPAAWAETGGPQLLADLGVVDADALGDAVRRGDGVAAAAWGSLNLDVWLRARLGMS